MTTVTILPIENLHRRKDARQTNDDMLDKLTESIKEIGLVNPIRVRANGNGYEVIAGAHRFAACDLLGHREIACIIVDDDDLHAELAMIDENLWRAELSPSDRAIQTARRKAIYLELHPETAEGVSQVAGMNRSVGNNVSANFAPTFAAATAKAIGQSLRSVQLHAERGEKVIGEAFDAIRGTPLDTGTYLDKLKRVAPAEQVATAQRDLETPRQPHTPLGGIAGRYSALTIPAARPPGEDFNRFIRLADEMEALRGTDLIAGSGRQRAVLGQRASSLADFMSSIMEGLSQ